MATVSARVDDRTKASAESVALEIGIPLSSAINIFLKKFASEGGFPFDVKVNANYTVMSAGEITASVQKMTAEASDAHRLPPVSYIDPETGVLVTKG